MPSDVTARAEAFVEEHVPEARGLGTALAELIDDPESFARTLEAGLERLVDPEYAAGVGRIAPGTTAYLGVRWPLWRAVMRQLRRPLRESSSSSAVLLAQRLAGAPLREVRLAAVVPLERSLPDDPERTWQVVRRLARASTDWISVDTLADLVAKGIVREPFRWSEIEQLVFSRSPWERRLVGSTIARLALQDADRADLRASPALTVIESVIGDADPNVQKALSWALREWTRVDRDGVATLLVREAARAAATDDGHRAWVLRDALSSQPRHVAGEVRRTLGSVRRHADAPPTSSASAVAAAFRDATGMADAALAQQGERMARSAR